MHNKIRCSVIFILLFFCALAYVYADDDTLTISTYYPSPYGVFKNMRFYPNDANTPGASCTREGETYFDDSVSTLYICSGTPGSYTWQVAPGLGGYWAASGNDIYSTNTGNAGIVTSPTGATSPHGGATGNLDANDVYLRNISKWASEGVPPSGALPVYKRVTSDYCNGTAFLGQCLNMYAAPHWDTIFHEWVYDAAGSCSWVLCTE